VNRSCRVCLVLLLASLAGCNGETDEKTPPPAKTDSAPAAGDKPDLAFSQEPFSKASGWGDLVMVPPENVGVPPGISLDLLLQNVRGIEGVARAYPELYHSIEIEDTEATVAPLIVRGVELEAVEAIDLERGGDPLFDVTKLEAIYGRHLMNTRGMRSPMLLGRRWSGVAEVFKPGMPLNGHYLIPYERMRLDLLADAGRDSVCDAVWIGVDPTADPVAVEAALEEAFGCEVHALWTRITIDTVHVGEGLRLEIRGAALLEEQIQLDHSPIVLEVRRPVCGTQLITAEVRRGRKKRTVTRGEMVIEGPMPVPGSS
jgi:hypothetical protein